MAWRYLEQVPTGFQPQLGYPANGYDFSQVEYAGSPLSAGFIPPAPSQPPSTRTQEATTGPAYQTFVNSFILAEFNATNLPFLARLVHNLPIDLGAHSRPPAPPTGPTGGRSRSRERSRRVLGVAEAERDRTRLLRQNTARDPRFDWENFPKTIGWQERGEKEQEARTVNGQDPNEDGEQQDEQDGQDPQVEIEIDFRVEDGRGAASTGDTNLGKRKRPETSSTTRTQDHTPRTNGSVSAGSDSTTRQASVATALQNSEQPLSADHEERQRRAQELLQQEKERALQRRLERERRRKKRVNFVPRLYDRFNAPVIPSRFEYYCQWYDRYAAHFEKIDAEDVVEQERARKLMKEGRSVASIYEEARALEALAPTSSRSKYNPKSSSSYAAPDPLHIPKFFPPIPPANQPKIEPHVPRHRQAQPVKSSLLKRTSRRVADAAWAMGARAVGAMRNVVGGFAGFVRNGGSAASSGGEEGNAGRSPRIAAADSGIEVSSLGSGLTARTLANGGWPMGMGPPSARPAAVAPPPPVAEEDEKSDTEERFYQPPPSAVEDDDDDDDALAQMFNQSRGARVAEQRGKSGKSAGKAPEVVVYSRRDLDGSSADPPALPEIGTDASRPLTRDNTAFNAAELDFVPLTIQDDDDDKISDLASTRNRVIARLPPNASRAQVEAAEANERYRVQEARYELQQRQWQEYLRSLGGLGAQLEVEPFRPGDSWRDDESDEEDDGPDGKRRRTPVERGRRRERAGTEDHPEDKTHPRLKSPPPEHRLPDMEGADDDEKADFDNTVGGRLRSILQKYDKRYEPEVADTDDSDAENSDFAGIQLDDDLEEMIDEIEVPELAAAPLYGSGFNRDRVMPKLRRPDRDRERDLERQRREARRHREADERRASRWASGVPGSSTYRW